MTQFLISSVIQTSTEADPCPAQESPVEIIGPLQNHWTLVTMIKIREENIHTEVLEALIHRLFIDFTL